jgi:hypothetical protein
MVCVGRRWIGHTCDSIRDGNHIAISAAPPSCANSPPIPIADTNQANESPEHTANANYYPK